MGSRAKLIVVLTTMLLVTSLFLPRTATAQAQLTACTGTAAESFTPPLTLTPSSGQVAISLSTSTPLTCTGVGSPTISLTFNGTTQTDAVCTGPLVITGSGSITLTSPPGTLTGVLWAAAGTPVTQGWVFAYSAGPAVALGVGAALDTPDIEACATSGSVSAVTLTAVLVMAA